MLNLKEGDKLQRIDGNKRVYTVIDFQGKKHLQYEDNKGVHYLNGVLIDAEGNWIHNKTFDSLDHFKIIHQNTMQLTIEDFI